MVDTVQRQNILWLSPSPLWGERSAWIRLTQQDQWTQPIILRFANDAFMDEMLAMLTHSPSRLQEWIARPETWRTPMPPSIVKTRPEIRLTQSYNRTNLLLQPHSKKKRVIQLGQFSRTPPALLQPITSDPIKLYQSAHQRYYVVTATLASEENGYPDYRLDLSRNERATLVVRALVKGKDGDDEYAFVTTPSGMAWRPVGGHGEHADVRRVLPNEEKLPLFPIIYADACDRFRQLFGGLIPVGKREEWVEAPAYDGKMEDVEVHHTQASDGGIDHHKEVFYSDVVGLWKALIEQAQIVKQSNDESGKPFPGFTWNDPRAKVDKARIMRTTRDEIQTGSWYVLLDFARFLCQHLPHIWNALTGKALRKPLNSRERRLVDIIQGTKIDTDLLIELAVENLIVGGVTTRVGQSLWERLIDLWRLEIYLKLARVLYESDDYSDLILERVMAHDEHSPFFKLNFTPLMNHFQTATQRTLLDLAKWIGDTFPDIKDAAIERGVLRPHGNQWHLAELLKDIQLPVSYRTIFQEIAHETSSIIDIGKSLWAVLSTFWTIETYFDHSLGAEITDHIDQYLNAPEEPPLPALDEDLLAWFYTDAERGDWYSFLDFARDLERNCPALQVAAVFEAFNRPPEQTIDAQTLARIDRLRNIEITEDLRQALHYANTEKRKMRIISSLSTALIEISDWKNWQDCKDSGEPLEAVTTPFDRSLQVDDDYPGIDTQWPDFLFPLADPSPSLSYEQNLLVPIVTTSNPDNLTGVEFLQFQLDELAKRVDALVPKEPDAVGKSRTINYEPFLDQRHPRFVVRCVFERPNCGALFPPLVSHATCQLEMAPYFDPDAPARTVRIGMPLDITPAGLRKYKRNAMFLISDMLCGKLKRIKQLTLADLVLSVLPWPFHKDLPNIGKTGPCGKKDGPTLEMFCSLSIPIVTLCALILLLVMVNLFNVFFKWIPYLFVCFPLPGLKGKENP